MNKWIKYGVTGVAILTTQASFAEGKVAAELHHSNATVDMDMDEFGGSKLKDRMIFLGGPEVEIVRALEKPHILKEIES
jgi:hypothetical protein